MSRVLSGFSRFARIRARASQRWDTRGCEFTEPLKNRGRAYFFADHRDLTGCRYYVVGHCCRPPGPGSRAPFIGLPSLSEPRGAEPASPLLHSTPLHSTPFSSLTPHIPRSLTRRSPILYLLYRRDQSRRIPRACAARNERSPVSCLSFRPSVQRTGRPVAFHAPYSSLLERSLFVPLFLLSATVVASARYSSLAWLPRYSISSLSTGTFVHIQIHADQVALSSRNSFRPGMTDLSPSF